MSTNVAASSVLIPSMEELAASTPIIPGEFKVYPMAKRPGITLMLITFDAGAVLPDHIAKGPILIQTLTGEVSIEAEGRSVALPAGGVMHIDARVEHALKAPVRSRVLLTLFEVASEAEPAVPGIIKKATAASPAAAKPQPQEAVTLIPVKDVSGHGGSGPGGSGQGGGCGCGEEGEQVPELDVRTIPHAIRHATVFGALEGIAPGSAMVLAAHHDPIPLLRQVEEKFNGAFEVSYLEEGPDVWRLRMERAN